MSIADIGTKIAARRIRALPARLMERVSVQPPAFTTKSTSSIIDDRIVFGAFWGEESSPQMMARKSPVFRSQPEGATAESTDLSAEDTMKQSLDSDIEMLDVDSDSGTEMLDVPSSA